MPESHLSANAEWWGQGLTYTNLLARFKLGRGWPALAVLAALAFWESYSLTAQHWHSLTAISEVSSIRLLISITPLLAGLVAALAIVRPWPAYLAVLLLTPVWDAAQVSWYTNETQVILQTVFLIALAVGCLVSPRRRATDAQGSPTGASVGSSWRERLNPRRLVSLPGLAAITLILFLILAGLSTAHSPRMAVSRNVLIHGILEPIGMGLVLISLRPNRRDIFKLIVVLGLSAGIGCLINIAQVLPDATSLAVLQKDRLVFSLLTYSNVGLLGEVLAMAVPLMVGALIGRKALKLSWTVTVLVGIALLLSLVGLFLTFSKSAWLGTAVGLFMLMLMAVRTWRRRAAIVVLSIVASGFVVPWPAIALRAVPPLDRAYETAMIKVMGQSRFDSWDPFTVAGEGSIGFRLGAAEAGLHMALDHPALGVGLDEYHAYYMTGYGVPPISTRIDHAHSIWPEVAAELGFPAMMLVGLLYLIALVALWRVHHSPPDAAARVLASALFAAMVGWIVVSTAFGSDIYRPARDMSSEMIMMGVITAAAIALGVRTGSVLPKPAIRRRSVAGDARVVEIRPLD